MPKVVKFRGKCYELSKAGYILPELEVEYTDEAEDWTAKLEWQNKGLEDTLGLEYVLNRKSIVVEVGGYLGEWAYKIWQLYHPNLYIFEPIEEFYDKIVKRMKGLEGVHILNQGLSDRSYTGYLNKCGDKTTVLNPGCRGEVEEVFFKDIGRWIEEVDLKQIDLLQLNCEGSEYPVLERLIDQDLIKRIKNLKIQFHNGLNGSESLRNEIREKLKQTHKETYCYPWVWESWERK